MKNEVDICEKCLKANGATVDGLCPTCLSKSINSPKGRKLKWFEVFNSSPNLTKEQSEYLDTFRTEDEFNGFLIYVDYKSCFTIDFMTICQGADLAMRHEKELLEGIKGLKRRMGLATLLPTTNAKDIFNRVSSEFPRLIVEVTIDQAIKHEIYIAVDLNVGSRTIERIRQYALTFIPAVWAVKIGFERTGL